MVNGLYLGQIQLEQKILASLVGEIQAEKEFMGGTDFNWWEPAY